MVFSFVYMTQAYALDMYTHKQMDRQTERRVLSEDTEPTIDGLGKCLCVSIH